MYVYVQFAGRRGNQFFQYWVARYIADQLGWPLTVCSGDYHHIYIDRHCYTNVSWEDERRIPDQRCVQSEKGPYCLDIEELIQEHRNTNQPIHIAKYLENAQLVHAYQPYIRHLYQRHVPKVDRIVIHIRLGDLASFNAKLNKDYVQFCTGIVAKHQKDVLIISEEPYHPCTTEMYNALNSLEQRQHHVSIKTRSVEQSDIDDIAASTIVIMTNSTFSWWPAYLSEYAGEVNVFLHKGQFGSDFRGDYLFVPQYLPSTWKLHST